MFTLDISPLIKLTIEPVSNKPEPELLGTIYGTPPTYYQTEYDGDDGVRYTHSEEVKIELFNKAKAQLIKLLDHLHRGFLRTVPAGSSDAAPQTIFSLYKARLEHSTEGLLVDKSDEIKLTILLTLKENLEALTSLILANNNSLTTLDFQDVNLSVCLPGSTVNFTDAIEVFTPNLFQTKLLQVKKEILLQSIIEILKQGKNKRELNYPEGNQQHYANGIFNLIAATNQFGKLPLRNDALIPVQHLSANSSFYLNYFIPRIKQAFTLENVLRTMQLNISAPNDDSISADNVEGFFKNFGIYQGWTDYVNTLYYLNNDNTFRPIENFDRAYRGFLVDIMLAKNLISSVQYKINDSLFLLIDGITQIKVVDFDGAENDLPMDDNSPVTRYREFAYRDWKQLNNKQRLVLIAKSNIAFYKNFSQKEQLFFIDDTIAAIRSQPVQVNRRYIYKITAQILIKIKMNIPEIISYAAKQDCTNNHLNKLLNFLWDMTSTNSIPGYNSSDLDIFVGFLCWALKQIDKKSSGKFLIEKLTLNQREYPIKRNFSLFAKEKKYWHVWIACIEHILRHNEYRGCYFIGRSVKPHFSEKNWELLVRDNYISWSSLVVTNNPDIQATTLFYNFFIEHYLKFDFNYNCVNSRQKIEYADFLSRMFSSQECLHLLRSSEKGSPEYNFQAGILQSLLTDHDGVFTNRQDDRKKMELFCTNLSEQRRELCNEILSHSKKRTHFLVTAKKYHHTLTRKEYSMLFFHRSHSVFEELFLFNIKSGNVSWALEILKMKDQEDKAFIPIEVKKTHKIAPEIIIDMFNQINEYTVVQCAELFDGLIEIHGRMILEKSIFSDRKKAAYHHENPVDFLLKQAKFQQANILLQHGIKPMYYYSQKEKVLQVKHVWNEDTLKVYAFLKQCNPVDYEDFITFAKSVRVQGLMTSLGVFIDNGSKASDSAKLPFEIINVCDLWLKRNDENRQLIMNKALCFADSHDYIHAYELQNTVLLDLKQLVEEQPCEAVIPKVAQLLKSEGSECLFSDKTDILFRETFRQIRRQCTQLASNIPGSSASHANNTLFFHPAGSVRQRENDNDLEKHPLKRSKSSTTTDLHPEEIPSEPTSPSAQGSTLGTVDPTGANDHPSYGRIARE